MTKADIIETVSVTCGFSKKESSDLVECVFSLIKKSLESGEDLKISGFGKFEVKHKNTRRGRNPQTGEALEISALVPASGLSGRKGQSPVHETVQRPPG